MHAERMREQCRSGIAQLVHLIPKPWSLEGFVRNLGDHRGRPITLMPFEPQEHSPCGLYIATATTDFLLHPKTVSRFQQAHVVFHEIAHMVFDGPSAGAEPGPLADREFASQLFPSLSLELIHAVLGRTCYDTLVEQRAETFATLMSRMVGTMAAPTAQLSDEQRGIADRLDDALDHSRWR